MIKHQTFYDLFSMLILIKIFSLKVTKLSLLIPVDPIYDKKYTRSTG